MKVTGYVYVFLCLQMDLANRWIGMILLYNEALDRSREGLHWGRNHYSQNRIRPYKCTLLIFFNFSI